MRAIRSAFGILILAAGIALPAVAQQQPPAPLKLPGGDKIETDQDSLQNNEQAQDTARIMEYTLPFRDGQTLRYYDGKGELEGWAQRRQLTIRFYDSSGKYIGRAQRVSQRATNYYTADGLYLGRRLNKKQTTVPVIHYAAPDEDTAE